MRRDMTDNFSYMTSMPGLFNIKDLNSSFVGFSQAFAEFVGWKSAELSFGKTDHDIPCGLADFADEFIVLDKKVIQSGKQMLALDIQRYAHGWGLVLAEKTPMKNEQGIVNYIFSKATDVSSVNIFKSYFKLYQFDTYFFGKKPKPASYILTDDHSPLSLTKKQESCLFLLIRGKTVKEIAKTLGVSPRTIECHLDAIKNKLNCQKKSEIIEVAIDHGFLHYIPQKIARKWEE